VTWKSAVYLTRAQRSIQQAFRKKIWTSKTSRQTDSQTNIELSELKSSKVLACPGLNYFQPQYINTFLHNIRIPQETAANLRCCPSPIVTSFYNGLYAIIVRSSFVGMWPAGGFLNSALYATGPGESVSLTGHRPRLVINIHMWLTVLAMSADPHRYVHSGLCPN